MPTFTPNQTGQILAQSFERIGNSFESFMQRRERAAEEMKQRGAAGPKLRNSTKSRASS